MYLLLYKAYLKLGLEDTGSERLRLDPLLYLFES